jgi:DNA-binding HxlR family transcriptional regulator
MTDRDVTPSVTDHVALEVLDLLSGKWHPVVVLTLLDREPLGFNEVLDAIPDVSGKVLSGTLEELGDAGIVDRTVVNESPLRVEYELTEAGRELATVFDAMEDWGDRHLTSTQPSVLLADGDPRITAMFESWLGDRYEVIRAHDGEAVRNHLRDPPDVLLVERGLPDGDVATLLDAAWADCRTILLLGKRPDLDLLDLDCNDVLRKPVVRDTAVETIETQLERAGEPEAERTRASLSARCAMLEEILPRESLEGSLEFFEASTRIEALEEAPEH